MNPSLGFRSIIGGLHLRFPSVECVSTETLQSWMEHGKTLAKSQESKQKAVKLIIIDARPEEEYIISHIAGGIGVDFETENMDSLKEIMLSESGFDSPEQVDVTAVMYCSVGYRSSLLASKLLAAIKPDSPHKDWQVLNLEGSIFKWAIENRPMVDKEGQPTNYVHPYNSVWGRLVGKGKCKWTL